MLKRTSRLSDLKAVFMLARYILRHDIRVLHCHNYTIFISVLASLFCPRVAIVWHDHNDPGGRTNWLYWLATRSVQAVISVNDSLADWAVESLGFTRDQVSVVPNFVAKSRPENLPQLPTTTGTRVVLVGNLHRAKGILTFIEAMDRVTKKEPNVQALLVGGAPDPNYFENIKMAIAERGLSKNIVLLGQRSDVDGILMQCDIGVLSSVSEGLPLALIEYGMAGLASVATCVGQCAEVLGDGRLGILVPPNDPKALSTAILRFSRSEVERKKFGRAFKQAAIKKYSPEPNIQKVREIYEAL
jgi:glycosyltransferase involved in cell wall biosynthesis